MKYLSCYILLVVFAAVSAMARPAVRRRETQSVQAWFPLIAVRF
jgi:hypothetical protein